MDFIKKELARAIALMIIGFVLFAINTIAMQIIGGLLMAGSIWTIYHKYECREKGIAYEQECARFLEQFPNVLLQFVCDSLRGLEQHFYIPTTGNKGFRHISRQDVLNKVVFYRLTFSKLPNSDLIVEDALEQLCKLLESALTNSVNSSVYCNPLWRLRVRKIYENEHQIGIEILFVDVNNADSLKYENQIDNNRNFPIVNKPQNDVEDNTPEDTAL